MTVSKNKYGNEYEYSLFLTLRKRHIKSCKKGSKKEFSVLLNYGIRLVDVEGNYSIHPITKENIKLVEKELETTSKNILKTAESKGNTISKQDLIYLLKWFDELHETKYKHHRSNWKLKEETKEELEEIEQSTKLKVLVDHLYDDKLSDSELEQLREKYYWWLNIV
jgi:hypothetical protein